MLLNPLCSKREKGMKMKKILLTAAVMMLLSTNAGAQEFLKIAGLINDQQYPEDFSVWYTTSVPIDPVTQDWIKFSPNGSNGTDSGVSVSAAYTTQNHTVVGIGVGDAGVVAAHPSMMFGVQSNNSDKVLYPPIETTVRMNTAGGPVTSYYSPTSS